MRDNRKNIECIKDPSCYYNCDRLAAEIEEISSRNVALAVELGESHKDIDRLAAELVEAQLTINKLQAKINAFVVGYNATTVSASSPKGEE